MTQVYSSDLWFCAMEDEARAEAQALAEARAEMNAQPDALMVRCEARKQVALTEAPVEPKAEVEAQMSVDSLYPPDSFFSFSPPTPPSLSRTKETADKQPLTGEYLAPQDWLVGNAEGIVQKARFSRHDGYDVKRCQLKRWWAKFPGNGDPGKVVVGPCKHTACGGCGPVRRYVEYEAIMRAFERVTPPGTRLDLYWTKLSENHTEALYLRIKRDKCEFEAIPIGQNEYGKKLYYVISTYGGRGMTLLRDICGEIGCAMAMWHESNKDGHRSCSKGLRAPAEVTDENEGAGDPPGPKALVVPIRDIRVTTWRLRERDLVEEDRGYVMDLKLGRFDQGFDLMLPYISGKSDRRPETYHRPARSVFKKVA